MSSIKDQFPFFSSHPNHIYLDSAATTHKPRLFIEALNRFYSHEYATVHRAIYQNSIQASEKYHQTRLLVRDLISAKDSNEIIFTRGTTDSLNIIAQSLGSFWVQEGDEIVLSEFEHHSNLVPWQMLAKKHKLELKFFSSKNGEIDVSSAITSKTKIVAIAHMSNVTGVIHPIQEIVKRARHVGALVVVDGAQGAPHLPVNVQDLDCDFYAFSAHKCYGPTGLGVLYGKYSILEKMPPVDGGGDMIVQVGLLSSTYQDPPLRFEAGTPNIADVIAFGESLKFLQSLGLAWIQAHGMALKRRLTSGLKTIKDCKIFAGDSLGPLATFSVEGVHPLDIATLLDLENISVRSGHLCAQPAMKYYGVSSALRASFGVYNTLDDVDIFLDRLSEILPRLR